MLTENDALVIFVCFCFATGKPFVFYRFHAGVDGIFSHVRAVWGGLGRALHLFVFFCVGVLPLYAWWRAVVEAGIHVLQE